MSKTSLQRFQVVDRGILNWLKNVGLRLALKFCKNRDKNLWVFGAWEGLKYSDNSKYLFEHIIKNHKNIKCIWVTKARCVYDNLNFKGYPCVLIGTKEWKEVMLKAGACFYTNGLDDFGDINWGLGAKFILLMHGVGFKEIGLERPIRSNKNTILRSIKKIKYFCYWHMFADYYITTSEYMRRKLSRQFYNVDINKVFITGQPRNDVLKTDCSGKNELTIVYMPTYRNNFDSAQKLENIITDLAYDNELKEILVKHNIKFYVKLHYLSRKPELKNNSNIYIYTDNECSDVQKMLLETKVLITDYSSVANDFALLNRPVVFFPFDKDIYLEEEGISPEYNDILISNTTAYDVKKLCKILENVLLDPNVAIPTLEKINCYFNDNGLVVGEFSENVYKTIYEQINYRK